jgi:hypothetical protein
LLALGEAAAAAPYFARAYAALRTDPWFASNEASRLERLRTLGQSALEQDMVGSRTLLDRDRGEANR